jgi:large subunit ribosomal protein L4
MTVDVVNSENEKVGSVDLSDEVFGGPIRTDLVWESVVRQNAADRSGTAMTKTRAMVSGSGRKPWRQKGTGRARVGDIRSPIWRKGGTVFGPQPRSYEFRLPRKVERAALRAALRAKFAEGVVVVVDALKAEEKRTRVIADQLERLGATRRTLLVDVALDENFTLSARNIPGTRLVASGRLTARDVMDTTRIIVTQAAVERLQEVLG